MATRTRWLAWLGALVLVAGAVIVLRTSDQDASRDDPPEVVLDRYAADLVVLPSPGDPPAPPDRVVVATGPGRLRLYWAEGLAGGTTSPGVVGYDVRWRRADGTGREGRRLVAAPDVQLDGLADDERYEVDVRGVDAFGRRSAPVSASGVPGRGDQPWRAGLTGLYDPFTDPATVSPDSPESRWHVSGYRGCVGLGVGRGLTVDLNCGADLAVLRARTPLRLGEDTDGELGRVAVRTDAAGPGGELTVDLAPGRPDRVGVGALRADRGEERDTALPGGAVRVSVSDGGVRIAAAPDVPVTGPTVEVHPAPRRGPGVIHLFEVVLTTSEVRVYQDGLAVASRPVRPGWREATVLLGLRGPAGRRSTVHVDGAGFSGAPAAAPAGVVEVPVHPGTGRVLDPGAPGPGIGIARTPLRTARSARVVSTFAMTGGLDLDRLEVQLGPVRVPARPVVARPATHPGASVTVLAELPPSLLGTDGPDTLAPFVLRGPGTTTGAVIMETYLEITPGPVWTAPRPAPAPRADRPVDALPLVRPSLNNAAGEPLESAAVPGRGQVVLAVQLDAGVAQWDTGGVAGVRGLQVRLDGRLVASIPTAEDGPGVGGAYALSIAVGGLSRGTHTIEVREYGVDPERKPVSELLRFSVLD